MIKTIIEFMRRNQTLKDAVAAYEYLDAFSSDLDDLACGKVTLVELRDGIKAAKEALIASHPSINS